MVSLLRVLVLLLAGGVTAGAVVARPEFPVFNTPVAPVIDGNLDDPGWEGAKISTGEWVTYNPVRGDQLAQKTDVWVAYDARNLYFGFRCYDPEPSRIKTSISRRDRAFNDDWVGLSLDAMNNGQVSYDMFVNPSGVQADILTSSSSGEDSSPDWVWESAGRLTPEGYAVEIRLPWQSVRFKSGPEVRMGLLFWRRVSRLGSSVSWPALPAGKSVFESHATAILDELKQPRTIEVIPSFTYSYNQSLESPGLWQKAESKPDAGVTVKYGLTSSITAETTINPDFSQVESDSFQVEVNQRYPVFFSEKRPFFMEGMGIFSLAGSTGDGNMGTTVHTRKIVDPVWGLKLTGTVGKFTFGTLSAADQAPGRELGGGELNPFFGENRYFNIARGLYSLGKGTCIGGMITDSQLADESNRVVASDVSLRLREHHNLSGTLLGTMSRNQEKGRRDGMGLQGTYGYHTDRVNVFSQLEHYDEEFQMDTAFYGRTGITNGWVYTDYSFLPDKKKYPWIRRISPLLFTRYGTDRVEDGDDRMTVVGAQFRFTRQGFLRTDWATGKEPWRGQTFDISWWRIMGEAQLTRWLSPFFNVRIGDGIYYDDENPFPGRQNYGRMGFKFQPSARVAQEISYSRVGFDRASTGERVYTVDVVNTRSSYQFNRNFYLRAILQFDSSRHRVLSDLLGSYELVPGTVAFVGYGALLHRQAWRDAEWHQGEGDYLTTRRGFFFKVSYLQRF
jgi:hypothetical protein